MPFYQGQTQDNLRRAKEIADDNGTWHQIQDQHYQITQTMESMSGLDDDMFQDCYRQSQELLEQA